jgi:FixJ family two-component response regulator
VEFLTKPFDDDVLLEIVHAALEVSLRIHTGLGSPNL